MTHAEKHLPTRQDLSLITAMYGMSFGMVVGLTMLITNEWFAVGAYLGMIHIGVLFDDIAKKLPFSNQRLSAC